MKDNLFDEDDGVDWLAEDSAPSVSADRARKSPPAARDRKQLFVRVPLGWVHRLAGARHAATYRVALHLLHREFRAAIKGATIRLPDGALEAEGVTRWQKWRALAELEAMGLIKITRRQRKAPEILLLFPADET
jgi:hypothetical protein